MLIATTERTAALRYEQGIPARLEWEDQCWHVLDVPTRIDAHGDAVYSPLMTHPPEPSPGWRFTAKSSGGTTYVFDIRELRDDRCEVLHVYE